LRHLNPSIFTRFTYNHRKMSDNELDAELLALAGSDSSDEEGDAEVEQFDDRSPTPEAGAKQSVDKNADNGPRRGVAQKVRAKRGSKARRRQDSEDEDADV
jgi:RNA polymerase-associated protein RTF1